MLDIKFVRQNKAEVKKAARDKQLNPKVVDKLLAADIKRRQLLQKVEGLRAERNEVARKRDIRRGKEIKTVLGKFESQLKKIEKEYKELMLLVPNITSSDTPLGKDDSQNKQVKKWGRPPKFNFKAKSHIELGRDLNVIDFKAGVKTSGFRGYYLKNEAALLHFAVLYYAWQKTISEGFAPMFPPSILREFALIGSGHFPFGRDNIYQIANPSAESLYLAGTAEPSLLACFANKTFQEEDLPVKVCGWTQCYRSEVGSYGKDTKGIYRVHEFMKVEQIVLCKNDFKVSNNWLEKMRGYSEKILQDLKLPYRVVQVCTGDMGAGKYKMYDIETWMPSRNGYGETHSDSNLTDWQSRRLNIRYKTKKGEIKYVHALNNTVIASPRILIPILENYQQKDGSVIIPKALRSLVGKKEIKA